MKKTALKRKTRLQSRPKPLNVKRILKQNPPRRFPRKGRKYNPNSVGFTQRVFALYGHYCLACPRKTARKAKQAHHVVPRQRITKAVHLTQEERDALEYDARNGLPICLECHGDHEQPGVKDDARIPRARLKPEHIAWAIEHGFETTINDRTVYP